MKILMETSLFRFLPSTTWVLIDPKLKYILDIYSGTIKPPNKSDGSIWWSVAELVGFLDNLKCEDHTS